MTTVNNPFASLNAVPVESLVICAVVVVLVAVVAWFNGRSN